MEQERAGSSALARLVTKLSSAVARIEPKIVPLLHNLSSLSCVKTCHSSQESCDTTPLPKYKFKKKRNSKKTVHASNSGKLDNDI